MSELAQVLAEGVADRGADTVFGLPGGGPNLDVVGAAAAVGLRFVLAHGETEACMMAATYGLLTGRPALAIATRGPGAACSANGAAQATLDRFPLLLVTDCVSSRDRERFAHQRIDQQQMLGAVTKWSGSLAATDDASAVVRGALDLAAARPAGAVHLDYDPHGNSSEVPGPTTPTIADVEHVERAAALVGEASRPVAIVGLEAVAVAGDVMAILERLRCPILTTYQALGVVPEGHTQQAGLYTSGVVESALIERCDLVIAVGLDQVEPMPFPWRYDVPVVSVSELPACSTLVPITVDVVGPIVDTLARVVGASVSTWPTGAGSAALAETRAVLHAAATGTFGPLELAVAVAASAPSNAIATVDAGAHFLAVMPFWPASAPLQLLISNGLATMGFAVPAAIGAALANPGRPVVCMVGDGGLAMTLAELETVTRLRLPVTVVVFDDAALSLIEIKQKPGQGGPEAVRFGPIDYAAVAAAMGLDAAVAATQKELSVLLDAGWDRPRLIDARIDPATYTRLITATRG
ncbi:MAG TPA: thiamine pyrophosphate-binding protein [Ilumatobacteraceae bacterium]|nr:thiamine pyrophosphate-binding protein [Ilumatobacteraceae bacterium]